MQLGGGAACHVHPEEPKQSSDAPVISIVKLGDRFPAAPVRERLIGRRARQSAVANPVSSSAIDNSSALELAQ
jgi:hypothetical protein